MGIIQKIRIIIVGITIMLYKNGATGNDGRYIYECLLCSRACSIVPLVHSQNTGSKIKARNSGAIKPSTEPF